MYRSRVYFQFMECLSILISTTNGMTVTNHTRRYRSSVNRIHLGRNMDMKPTLELFFRLQNQSTATFGAKEKDGDSMLSSPVKETELSKEAEGGLERVKEG